MTTCAHVLHDGPLTCTRTDAHDETARGGHTYAASDCADAVKDEEVCW